MAPASERDLIRPSAATVTRARVREDLGRLGVRRGSVLLVHSSDVPDPPRETWSAALMAPEGRSWVTWEDVAADEEDFEELGAAFDATGRTRVGPVGEGEARLMRQRVLLDFAAGWMAENR